MTTISGALSGWFKRRGKQNDAEDDAPAERTASGTTAATGGDGETEPVVVWEAPNRMEAEIVKSRLESEGIPAIITGDVAASIFGFHTGSLAKADVLVPAPLADRAIAILEASLEAPAEDEHGEPAQSEDETNAADSAQRET